MNFASTGLGRPETLLRIAHRTSIHVGHVNFWEGWLSATNATLAHAKVEFEIAISLKLPHQAAMLVLLPPPQCFLRSVFAHRLLAVALPRELRTRHKHGGDIDETPPKCRVSLGAVVQGRTKTALQIKSYAKGRQNSLR
jgi:hypothetical protein